MYSNRKKHKLANKTTAHRDALIKSQVTELIRSGRIKTTPSKAKVLKSRFDRLVTEAKKGTIASKRNVLSFFGNNERAANRLFDVIEDKLQDRNSGYTRVIKTLPRSGDNAPQAYVMLVNTEIEERKSRLQKMLDQDSKKDTKKKTNARKMKDEAKKESVKNVKDSSQARRRVSM
jgi:large subunit ribosomal protein L17